MSECVHHWVLEAPTLEGTPSVCINCNAEKTWPRPKYQTLNDGRPTILSDPLLPRVFNNGYGGPRPRNYY